MNIQWYNLPYPQGTTNSYLKEPGVPCVSIRTVQEGKSLKTQVLDWKEGSEYPLTSLIIYARIEHDLFMNLYLTAQLLMNTGMAEHGITKIGTLMGFYHNSCTTHDTDGPLYVKEFSLILTEAPSHPIDQPMTISECSELGLPNEIQP